MTVRRRGLYRESSYSSSLDCFCLMRRLRSLSTGPCGPHVANLVSAREDKIIKIRSHPVNPHAQVHKRINGVHLGLSKPCVLVQPATILVGNAFSVLDVKRDDANLVGVTITAIIRIPRA
jgi:hypothetical protein